MSVHGSLRRDMDNEQQPQDEIARILAADPHATVVEGSDAVWLLSTPAQVKVAREALGRRDDD